MLSNIVESLIVWTDGYGVPFQLIGNAGREVATRVQVKKTLSVVIVCNQSLRSAVSS